MKTLYESILDDEEILIGDIKNTINDPFVAIVAAIDSGMDEIDLAKFIAGGVFDKFVEEDLYLKPKYVYWSVKTFNDSIVSMALRRDDIDIDPLVIRYRRKTKILQIEIHKYSNYGKIQKFFEYDKYKKILSNIRKRGFKKSNSSLDKIGNYNVYNKKI